MEKGWNVQRDEDARKDKVQNTSKELKEWRNEEYDGWRKKDQKTKQEMIKLRLIRNKRNAQNDEWIKEDRKRKGERERRESREHSLTNIS